MERIFYILLLLIGLRRKLVLCTIALVLFFNPLSAKAIAFQLMASKSEQRSELVGEWEVESSVTWSDCKYVAEGSSAVSKIRINDINGKLYPEWQANDWHLVRNKVIDFNYDNSLHWERESKLEEAGDYWFVRTITDFRFNKTGDLVAKGHVKQYLNGEFVGAYMTESHLKKVNYSASAL
ncbi:MAG: hypothetical protein HOA17_08540 [Candidatus Melainabacteria bacterium]|nr:hypothetical protein [Candidatus Melainabacteria bacterium]